MAKKTYENLIKRLYEVPGTAEYMNSYPVKRESAILRSRKRAWITPLEMNVILKNALRTRSRNRK